MAIVVSKVDTAGNAPSAPQFLDRFDVVMDASYPTGGEDFDLALLLPGKTVLAVVMRGKVTATGFPSVQTYEHDAANDKIIALTEARVQVADTTDLSADTVEVYVWSQ